MIEFRSFHNTDSPSLAEVWRSQGNQRGLMQPMSAHWFEQMVLAKPMFEASGLIVALQEKTLLGFSHCSFGPTADGRGISTDVGGASMLMVRQPEVEPELADELLNQSEAYLKSRGTKTLVAGGAFPADAFYLGLSGGSNTGGLLDAQSRLHQLYQRHGYHEVGHAGVYHLDLCNFQAPVDRRLLQVRRRTTLGMKQDPPSDNWWEACTFGGFERIRFELRANAGNAKLASVTFWLMDPLSRSWGVRAAGIESVEVIGRERKLSVATFLLGEAFKQLNCQGITLVEARVPVGDPAAEGLFKKLGFRKIDLAVTYQKQVDGVAV